MCLGGPVGGGAEGTNVEVGELARNWVSQPRAAGCCTLMPGSLVRAAEGEQGGGQSAVCRERQLSVKCA